MSPPPPRDQLLQLAYRWGHQDATTQQSLQGSVWFVIESPPWFAYTQGYHDGLAARNAPPANTADLSEQEFLDQVLTDLRARQVAVQLTRLPPADPAHPLDGTAAEEAIGKHFSQHPYAY